MSKLFVAVAVPAILLLGCQPNVPDVIEASPEAHLRRGETDLRITGPYAHENLAVYLIHSDEPDNREFITLDEGFEKEWVELSEKQQEQVSELQIENKSDKPLFLQEGDRLRGGKQDRIISISMVVPARSGKMKVPAFCVEQGRWSRGDLGTAFGATDNPALASQAVRYASKVAGDQGRVWQEVAEEKATLEDRGVLNNTSSLNEAFDSEEMKKISAEYERQLGGVFAKHPDAVGVAFVLNGKVLEVDIYPGNDLLKKISPRLLRSYAIQASGNKQDGVQHPEPSEIAKFMEEAGKRSEETRKLDEGNSLRLFQYDKKVNCDTVYEGKSVHVQWMAVVE
jgi:hypothetical protein